jgi:hypothetical protein
MGSSWRQVAVVAATVATAVVAFGPSVDAADPSPVAHGRPGPTTPAGPGPSGPALGPVTVHDLEGQPVLPAPERDGQAVEQVVQLQVVGGSLTLEDDLVEVPLSRGADGTWRADLPPVQVVDARGSHAGWEVRWSLDEVVLDGAPPPRSVGAARVQVRPAAPVVVDGTTGGLVAGRTANGAGHGRQLAAARPGWGGGTYAVGGTVSVRVPRHLEADEVVVRLRYRLA